MSVIATAGAFTKPQFTDLANLSRWAFLLTFAGVGLRTNIREMSKQGLRPFIVGAVDLPIPAGGQTVWSQ